MIKPDIFPDGVIGFFTTSSDPQDEMLLSIFNMKALCLAQQRHTDRIIIVNNCSNREIADGLITEQKGLLLGIKVADCLPVLIYARRFIAAIHAGWRGTAKAILAKAIDMLQWLGAKPEELFIAFGPSIRGCCYTVGNEVVDALRKVTPTEDFVITEEDSIKVDLLKANMAQAIDKGVPEHNIWVSHECTYCSGQRFFSFRRDKTSKRQGAYIGLKCSLL